MRLWPPNAARVLAEFGRNSVQIAHKVGQDRPAIGQSLWAHFGRTSTHFDEITPANPSSRRFRPRDGRKTAMGPNRLNLSEFGSNSPQVRTPSTNISHFRQPICCGPEATKFNKTLPGRSPNWPCVIQFQQTRLVEFGKIRPQKRPNLTRHQRGAVSQNITWRARRGDINVDQRPTWAKHRVSDLTVSV